MSFAAGSSRVEAAIREIEAMYAFGQEILDTCGERSPHGLIGKLAAKYNVNRDTAQKYRAIANPKTGYTRKDLDELFRIFREKQRVLSIAHLVILLRAYKGLRNTLTLQALDGDWSCRVLCDELNARQGRLGNGGRRPALIDSRKLKGKLLTQLQSWQRWLESHRESITGMDSDVSTQIAALQKTIAATAKAVDLLEDAPLMDEQRPPGGKRRGRPPKRGPFSDFDPYGFAS
jgi:hypothetical protein